MPRKVEKCVCHNKPVKPHKEKQARCPVKGHYCSTYTSPYRGVSRRFFAEQVNTVTEQRMMPKIADELLSENPIIGMQLDRVFVENANRHSRLMNKLTLWQAIWPWSEYNQLSRELAFQTHRIACKMEAQQSEGTKIKIGRINKSKVKVSGGHGGSR